MKKSTEPQSCLRAFCSPVKLPTSRSELPRPVRHFLSAAGIFLLLLWSTFPAVGATIYEPFDYAMEDGETFVDVPVNTMGLRGNWVRPGNSPDAIVEFQSEGLSFTDHFFPSSGGALRLITTDVQMGSTIRVEMDSELHGDVWQSYLFEVDMMEGPGRAILTTLGGMIAAAKAQNSGISETNRARPGVGYPQLPGTSRAAWDTGVADPPDQGLIPAVTYLLVAKFGNFREPIEEDRPAVAKLWVFDDGTYLAWRDAGGGKEDTLDEFALWRAETKIEDPSFSWDEAFSPQNRLLAFSNYRFGTVVFDELRIGPTLESVAIPNP